ncbi:MAG: sigma-54 dependent transcriptional regulator [Ignavibacteria bacterium]|jgi:DNA-binding NtrC family response regulator|nr:sigma-54 dependent transcriptional regulator [Ignavibacteria bacterium]
MNYNSFEHSNNISQQYRASLQNKFGIVGDSAPIQRAIDTLIEVAPTDLAVLITGETGTGKEVFANAVHTLSNRSDKPFVSVNCGAIPETLLESELFGHEKGAFTGAVDQRIGFFEAANKGTIFLDEIGEMPIGTQVKLLRILESGEFSRLGSSSISKVNVRLIAATNRNLEVEVQNRNFRQDLYYRLNSVNIVLPALRNHIQDIPLYFKHFAEMICTKNGIQYQGISDNALSLLMALPWQGNIREFKNLVDKVITLERGVRIDSTIIRKYITPALPNYDNTTMTNALVPTSKNTDLMSNDTLVLRTLLEIKQDIASIKQMMGGLGSAFTILSDEVNSIKDNMIVTYDDNNQVPVKLTTLDEMERKLIIQTLEACWNNRHQAAKSLGISERTLYRKIKELGIE